MQQAIELWAFDCLIGGRSQSSPGLQPFSLQHPLSKLAHTAALPVIPYEYITSLATIFGHVQACIIVDRTKM